MSPAEELLEIATRLENAAKVPQLAEAKPSFDAIEHVADEVARSFSGSWMGYHANVYYAGLKPPPPGAYFDQEWGLKEMLGTLGSRGDWIEHDPIQVKAHIDNLSGKPDLSVIKEAAGRAADTFERCKSDALSILTQEMQHDDDPFLKKIATELDKREPLSTYGVADRWHTKGAILIRDVRAMNAGSQMPPHIERKAEVASLRCPFELCEIAADLTRRAGSHLERKQRLRRREERVGTNVFIGHGRSLLWRELKDFVAERLKLPWDEFNRVPVAGVTNIARLSEMLDAAAIALLIMTAEDEMADGEMQARMNVIHEVGLFQGRLGFTKAIVLVEVGCNEFTNVQGLGQIRFPKGNIGASFEEIRRVLEREGLVEAE